METLTSPKGLWEARLRVRIIRRRRLSCKNRQMWRQRRYRQKTRGITATLEALPKRRDTLQPTYEENPSPWAQPPILRQNCFAQRRNLTL